MSLLSIKKSWLNSVNTGENTHADDELRATWAKLEILLGKQNLTAHKLDHVRYDALDIPLYYLAEWIAESWWVLLFEPQKNEANDDPGFITRHSIISAQHGFPLPALTIIPFGRSVRLNCRPRRAQFAELSFITDAFGDAPTEQVQSTFRTLLDDVDSRLRDFKIEDTNLQVALKDIARLSDEEREFCELLGALGVSPSCAGEDLSSAVEDLFEILGPGAVKDYCLAATPKQVLKARVAAEQLRERLPRQRDANLELLIKADLPAENFQAPSWRRGMQAAKNLREKLKIDVKDERGASKIFEKLEIDMNRFDAMNADAKDVLDFSGAVERETVRAKIALFQDGIAHRRFAAGRAAFLCWVSGENSRRLMTSAVTRDQQASRQFAAEILVPQEYLKKCATNGKLNYDHVREIASLREAMPDVAFKQAYNAGIEVAGI